MAILKLTPTDTKSVMTGFSIIDRGRQIIITGIEGAGRRSFASIYFPTAELIEKPVRLSKKVKEVVVIAILDSRHLQNQAEADALRQIAVAVKRWKSAKVRILLVLGQTDLVCNRRQNRYWVAEVMREYKPYLSKLRIKVRTIVAHSNLAIQRLREIENGEVDVDDVDDLDYLLSKAGRRLPKVVSSDSVKTYISSHRKALQMLTGEYYVNKFLKLSVKDVTQKEK